LLTAQIAVAWAGEEGDEPRLAWWRTDLASEFGGEDLFRRVLPDTWEWAVLQAVREAARRHDAELRRQDHAADGILSLYSLGFELDERVEERLQDLKRSRTPPRVALAVLAELMGGGWDRGRFQDWIAAQGEVSYVPAPVGRRIRNYPPSDLRQQTRLFVAALAPLPAEYPLPHFRQLS
ncbi:MAG TPA: BREX-6 system BrxE protein, partial [Longimicrobiaceae bacterium]|nr:BREX-6 system BrxE protein [Longimicrobiaceae bacterium]